MNNYDDFPQQWPSFLKFELATTTHAIHLLFLWNWQRMVPSVITHPKHQQLTLTQSLLWDRQVAEGACQYR